MIERLTMLRRLPILSQTLLLVVFTLVASLVVNFLLITALPAPRLDFYSMRDIAEALSEHNPAQRVKRIDSLLDMHIDDAPPEPVDHMVTNASLSRRLAGLLDLPESRVRLFYEADQSNWPFRYSETASGVPMRLGEAQFYNTVVAAVQRDDGRWKVMRSPPRPFITRFQKRSLTAFLLSVLAVLPFAFLFARQLTLPIRRFAEAAEAVGADHAAPAVPIEGSTELRQAAEALSKMQARLLDTLAERTAMVGAIAHDLRTPLTRIAFRIEAAPDPVRIAVLADIEQMRAMVEATIGFIRHGHELGERRLLDLHQLAARVVADAQEMGHPVSLAVLDPGARNWVMGDAVALERVMQNIINNAVSYAGAAEVIVTSSGLETVLQVADRGPGLDDAQLDEVFKPFNRGEPSRSRQTGGVGLGLAIARLIVTAHGGALAARNRRGGGLLLEARLPAVPPPRQSRLRIGATASPVPAALALPKKVSPAA
ncbi:two-component sensor histidine kinase [Polymorphobacter multimanifer]|uniref:histidine kinase n=1 Tax=Polymorphobacter multimanifer TaxID=1070431 RepID=A0A841LDH0_9SPHN|nr:ATP-binding protein [Polymorphobacter multimanifer]MBB6229053.1 signal transduction histidine kinase [Polymorphobacter multimanifer]GGI77067.1 two-component sensor histidine kinase [Polymorphobacter multimanifer]